MNDPLSLIILKTPKSLNKVKKLHQRIKYTSISFKDDKKKSEEKIENFCSLN